MSTEYWQDRLGESEIMYEDLEETYYVHISVLVGLAAQLYWDTWYISVAIGLLVAFMSLKFLALKPFTNGVSDSDR